MYPLHPLHSSAVGTAARIPDQRISASIRVCVCVCVCVSVHVCLCERERTRWGWEERCECTRIRTYACMNTESLLPCLPLSWRMQGEWNEGGSKGGASTPWTRTRTHANAHTSPPHLRSTMSSGSSAPDSVTWTGCSLMSLASDRFLRVTLMSCPASTV